MLAKVNINNTTRPQLRLLAVSAVFQPCTECGTPSNPSILGYDALCHSSGWYCLNCYDERQDGFQANVLSQLIQQQDELTKTVEELDRTCLFLWRLFVEWRNKHKEG